MVVTTRDERLREEPGRRASVSELACGPRDPPERSEWWRRRDTRPGQHRHGSTIPAAAAQRWTNDGLDARFLLALLSKTKAVEGYSSTQRIFTERQRLAMIARDGGCSFPDCDAAPAYTEAHHVTDWAQTQHTSIGNGTLACCNHHRHALESGGWATTMLDGIPHWVSPRYIDPEQEPRRNTRHDRLAPHLP